MMMCICPLQVMFNLDHLIKVFLLFFLFVNKFGGRCFETMKIYCFSLNFCPLILFYFIFLINFIYLFISGYIGSSLAVHWLSLVAASRGYSSLRCTGFSLRWLLLFRSSGSRSVGFSSCGTRTSVLVACGLSSCGAWA